MISEFCSRFKELNLKNEIKKGTSVYNGIFNLLVLKEARDWMTGYIPQFGDLDDHHIVPQSWGKRNLNIQKSIHTILNRTPLTAQTNRNVIGDELPNKYIPKMFDGSSEDQVKTILESHLISPTAIDILLRNPFGPDDYEDFINERQKTILDAIEDLLINER